MFEPKSKSESDKVLALAKSKGVRDVFWIGINDKARENRFVYESDGKNIGWKNWNGGEPNNCHPWRCQEDCVEVTSNGKWNDKNCNIRRSFVCEM